MPWQENETIQCKSIHVQLDEEPRYEVLFYTWGNLNLVVPMILDGKPFYSTENLHFALQHLRYESEPRTFWIDALYICIDQLNDEEKSYRIPRVRAIYQKASKILLWLSVASDDSNNVAMDLLAGDLTAGTEEAEAPKKFHIQTRGR